MTLKNSLAFLTLIFCTFLSTTLSAKTHVYILAGQSNMMGKTQTHQLPSAYRQTPANITFYYQGRERKLADDAYFGPEVVFAHEVSKAFPDDQHIIIKYVASGSYIHEWAKGQPLYKGLIRQFKLALPSQDNNTFPNVDSVIWMQGESDCRSTELAQAYGGRLNQLIHDLRKDLASPHSLFIIGSVSPQNVGFPAVNDVRLQQKRIHQSVVNTRLIETKDLETFDNTHFNTNGLMELGKRFAEAYVQQYLTEK
jgi:hypothetical protein